mmetsp:Transcript_2186/g.4974  ORF Transcript_2186/g.4974 Transcript_2186/m.4974 type:complete len:231 (-) Transcript_2186:577-1269(-)
MCQGTTNTASRHGLCSRRVFQPPSQTKPLFSTYRNRQPWAGATGFGVSAECHGLELLLELLQAIHHVRDGLPLCVVGNIPTLELHGLFATVGEPVYHLHHRHTHLFRRLEHVVCQDPEHCRGILDEVGLRLTGMHEEPRKLRSAAKEATVTGLQDVHAHLGGCERQHHPVIFYWVVLQDLDKVPHYEQNLCSDFSSLSKLVHDSQHGFCPVEISFVQVEWHDGLVAQAVS